jgi:predicted membrane protein
MNIQELRNKPLVQRLMYFVLAMVVWFFIAYQINTSYTDALKKSENLRSLWIISTIVFAVLWNVFFNKRKQDIDNKTE